MVTEKGIGINPMATEVDYSRYAKPMLRKPTANRVISQEHAK
jgi:hypothetical protein